jgi:taurine dioxygenase
MQGVDAAIEDRAITVIPYSPILGAEIGNIDLTRPLSDTAVARLRRALLDHSVLFFRDQRISFDDQVRLAEYFGSVGTHVGKNTNSEATGDPRVRRLHAGGDSHRVSGNVWHTDQSCARVPPMASILYLHTVPQGGGGDTGFADMYAAYDALSSRMKAFLEGLTAYHDGVKVFGEETPSATHPVVVRHPETGRKLIYVNRAFTTHINGIPEGESDAILGFLFDHCARPEWTIRFRWQPHSIAFWDNRSTQHRANADYLPQVRSGYRVQIEGATAPAARAP